MGPRPPRNTDGNICSMLGCETFNYWRKTNTPMQIDCDNQHMIVWRYKNLQPDPLKMGELPDQRSRDARADNEIRQERVWQ